MEAAVHEGCEARAEGSRGFVDGSPGGRAFFFVAVKHHAGSMWIFIPIVAPVCTFIMKL